MSTLRVLCRPSGVATSTAYLQAFRGWRDPDSNRGHHDFQSLRPRRREARNPWKQAVPARRARDGDVSNLQVYRRDSGDGWPPIPLLSARCLGRVLGRPGRRPRGPAPRRAVPLRNRRPEIAASVRRLNSAALARTLRREERSSRGRVTALCPSCTDAAVGGDRCRRFSRHALPRGWRFSVAAARDQDRCRAGNIEPAGRRRDLPRMPARRI
jgi:hypothetical protein